MIQRPFFTVSLALTLLVASVWLAGCSKKTDVKGKAAGSSQDCAQCNREKASLSSRLKAAESQVRKLKRQLRTARGDAPRGKETKKAPPAPSR